MRVAVVLEHRFPSSPDGRVWTDGPFPYSFFTRYLGQFEQVAAAWAYEDRALQGRRREFYQEITRRTALQ